MYLTVLYHFQIALSMQNFKHCDDFLKNGLNVLISRRILYNYAVVNIIDVGNIKQQIRALAIRMSYNTDNFGFQYGQKCVPSLAL